MIALFFDTETTGFKHGEFIPEIVQIGALLQDTETRRILAELNVIVTAKEPIPQVVSDIHGITDELNAAFGVASVPAESMFGLMVQMADVVVAHNIAFDIGIIKDAWPMASSLLADKQQYCTMLRATEIVGIPHSRGSGYKNPKLAEAYRFFYEADFENAHDAMADVRACRDVYFALLNGAPERKPAVTSKQTVLELIEQSKEKDLPLTWLAKQITEL